jgi:hypothetical protein
VRPRGGRSLTAGFFLTYADKLLELQKITDCNYVEVTIGTEQLCALNKV